MLSMFDGLREVTLASVFVRLTLAVLCGGVIGMERSYKRRPAGFRTHILICIGAAITTLTSQYLYLNMHYFTDMARLGAQVVAGIGFIGAGTIIVTRRQRVKGLTTAAGLWTCAIIGLAFGGGFYEGGILTTVLIMAAELVFSKLEYRVLDNVPEINLYMEYTGKICLDNVLQLYRDNQIKLLNIQITRSTGSKKHNACAIFSLRLPHGCGVSRVLKTVGETEGVISVEEL
ncbi:MgtC/SapB family protein [Butyricicoccus sp.]|uniref:MgtC/SapB family protein n=1 Tax=Butyricicoccus sp. TaxID=2049021 RepID=UPI003D7D3DDA